MKKLTAITVCSLSFAFGSSAFAQTPEPDAPELPGAPMTSTAAPESPAPEVPLQKAQAAVPDAQLTLAAPKAEVGQPMVNGWSVENEVLGVSVYNEQDEKVGDIQDVILNTDGTATHYVVGVGGFLGMGEHDVALPFKDLHAGNDRFTIQGYTKDRLNELPEVEVQ